MGALSRRGLSVVTAGCAAAAVLALVVVATHRPSSGAAPKHALRVLQFNLCNSGIAGCYTGRSVTLAATIIRSERPDLVTLNEVCRSDVTALDRTLSTIFGGHVVSAFRAAVDRRDNGNVRCRNGQQYGIGLVAHLGSPVATYGGEYPMQGGSDVEDRVWLCVHADSYACTTHLDSTAPADAFAQCRYLLHKAIPAMVSAHGADPLVLAGDLNLETGRSPDPRTCFPTGYAHADDGARQHVVASGFRVVSSRTIDMQGTTDHPGLLVDLARTVAA